MNAERGVIYYAVGDEYLQEAFNSAKTLKKHNELHVTVFTDISEAESRYVDEFVEIDSSDYPFYDRINYFKKSPYERTLHLDTDTRVAGDITPIFEMLERFDVVAAIDPMRDTTSSLDKNIELDVPKSFPEYQCGVIGYRKDEEVLQMLNDWQEKYDKHKNTEVLDQPFFREAVYNSKVNLGTLPSEYNLLVNTVGYVQDEAVIFHFNGEYRDEIPLPIIGDPSKEEVITKINSKRDKRRVFYRDSFNRLKMSKRVDDNILVVLLRSIWQNGVLKTLKKVLRRLRG